MKIIEEKSEHWALGKEFTCVKCKTEQVIENLDDFTLDRQYDWLVYSDCGHCEQSNAIQKVGNPFAGVMDDIDMSIPLKKKSKRWSLL